MIMAFSLSLQYSYKAVRTMRRYSSMTSIYSMSTSHLMHDDDDEDDEEEISDGGQSVTTPSTEDSQNEGGFKNDSTPPQNRQARPLKMRSLSHDE